MALTFRFFDDPGLTRPSAGIQASRASDGSGSPVDRVVYLGSNAPISGLLDAANPYVAAMAVGLVDINTGLDVEAAHLKLALSQAALDSAVAGAPVDIGIEVRSGPENSLPIHIRITTPALSAGVYGDLALKAINVAESGI